MSDIFIVRILEVIVGDFLTNDISYLNAQYQKAIKEAEEIDSLKKEEV